MFPNNLITICLYKNKTMNKFGVNDDLTIFFQYYLMQVFSENFKITLGSFVLLMECKILCLLIISQMCPARNAINC